MSKKDKVWLFSCRVDWQYAHTNDDPHLNEGHQDWRRHDDSPKGLDPIRAYYEARTIAKCGRYALVFAPTPDNTLLYSLGPADVVDTLSTNQPPAAPAAPANTSESEP